MELKEIFNFYKSNFKVILGTTILAGLLGVAGYFLLPRKYYASGSLFIRRSIYPFSENHFTYEGYYGQQAAQAYTNSIMALIESEDIMSYALKNMNIEVNEASLRKYGKKIKVVKDGPQLIGLVVKEKSEEEATNLWEAITNTSAATMNNLSRQNDPFVGVVRIAEKPIVKTGYRSIPVCVVVGMSMGFLLSTGVMVLINYIPVKKRLFKK